MSLFPKKVVCSSGRTKFRNMEAIQFVAQYPSYIETIKKVTKDEYHRILDEMCQWEPHDLLTPESWLQSENEVIGYVYRLFLIEVKKLDKKLTPNN